MNFIESPQFKIELTVKNNQNKAHKLLTELVVEKEKSYILGRSQNQADIVLNDPNASRQHFTIKVIKDQIYIQDLSTKNGTFLNGQKIEQSLLVQGDIITLGDHKIYVSKVSKISNQNEVTSMLKCQKVDATVKFEIIRGCGVA